MLGLGIFAAAFALYGLVAVRAERLGVSRPLVFVVAGALVAVVGWAAPLPNDRPAGLLLPIAEVALALVLFADASRRHLGTGIPLGHWIQSPVWSIGLSNFLHHACPSWSSQFEALAGQRLITWEVPLVRAVA